MRKEIITAANKFFKRLKISPQDASTTGYIIHAGFNYASIT
jgi:hypothetical protein